MNSIKSNKRKRGRPPMIDGDVDSAQVVTQRTITETKHDGSTVKKQVWVSLDKPGEKSTAVEKVPERPPFDYEPVYEPADMSSPQRTNKSQTQKDYIEQYVDRMDELLEALLSREAMPGGPGTCRHCDRAIAVWRCKDCLLATPMCRLCMRLCHRENPFHRIQQWNGFYFRPAELWEVGTYLLVQHHTGEAVCETLRQCCDHLEKAEDMKDNAEQVHLRRSTQTPFSVPMPGPEPDPEPDPEQYFDDIDIDIGEPSAGEDDLNDENDCDKDEDIENLNPYLTNPGDGYETGAGSGAGSGSPAGYAFTLGNLGTYIRVVHSNGLHHIAMISCQCHGEDVLPLDLFAAQLLPASFKRIKTLFTAQVLDMFRLCNLELKASAYQFYQLLRRLTNPTAPGDVINLYREFRRMSRLWRWMKKLKWAGYAGSSTSVNEVGAGELAIFCPACPQPGINIPDDWKDDPARWVYKRVFVADGNFKADHVRQKNSAGDVWLSEGSGIFPKRHEYMSFLASAIERLTKAPCENTFRAIMNALQASKVCDVTGLVGIACGRHGCYAPQALVDLFKGEQQKNVDFAFLKALTSTSVAPEQGILLIYDIACQYFVHLKDRIGTHLPFGLDIDAAIGLFHVHAHKEQCFFQYATSFIPGAAIVAGEILESLWSSLNSISPTARTATLAHRAEMLDDHANDSNHKKTLGIISSLCRSHRNAVDMLEHAKRYYKNLSDEAGKPAVERWTVDIEAAEFNRKYDITAMDIYAAKLADGTPGTRHPAPGIQKSPLASWMELSLCVEEKQLEIQSKVRQMGQNPCSTDRQTIDAAREHLTVLLNELKIAMHTAGVVEVNGLTPSVHEPLAMWDEILYEPVPTGPNTMPEEADRPDSSNSQTSNGPIHIEHQLIPLPSNGNVGPTYAQLEISHRISHAEDHLNRIRDLIAEKSFQYSHVIRVSPRKGVNTQSRAAVKKLNLQISIQCRLYTQCRSKLVTLGAEPATFDRFQILKTDDIKASTAIVNPNEPGSTRLKLSWIWQTGGGHRWGLTSSTNGAIPGSDVNVLEFRRVHWLRARSQLMRWQEQVTLTGYEMQWTVRYFLHKSRTWVEQPGTGSSNRSITGTGINRTGINRTGINSTTGICPNTGINSNINPGIHLIPKLTDGAIAYRRRKQALWEDLMIKADRIFARSNPAYQSPL